MKTRSAVQNGEIKLKRKWKTPTDFKPQRYSNQHENQWKGGTKMQITCFSCGLEGHYSSQCNQRDPSLSATPDYTTCYSCGLHGHYASQCNQRDPSLTAAPGSLNENQAEVLISKVQSLRTFKRNLRTWGQYQDKINGTVTCMVCGMEGHYSRECPLRDRKDKLICTICSKDGHGHLWCCQQRKSENRACTRCGELGHIDSNHRLDCSSCDEHHSLGNCRMSRITCFLCEGQDHCPAQCPLNSVLTTVFQNQREDFRVALRHALSGENSNVATPAELSKESEVCEPSIVEESVGKKASSVKCFSCGEEGHRANCCPSKPQTPNKAMCYNCGEEGHYRRRCPHKH